MEANEPKTSVDARGAIELGATNSTQPAPNGGQPQTPALKGPLIRDVSQAELNDIVELSFQLPVVVDLWAQWCQPCKQLTPILEETIRAQEGRVILAKVDVDANPQIAQALQASSVPTVVAIIGGRPLPLFQGVQPRKQVEAIITELLQVAQNAGINGRMISDDSPEETIDPLHVPALEAEDEENWEEAVAAWQNVLNKRPRDTAAKEGLARAQFQLRLSQRESENESEDTEAGPLATADKLFAAGDHAQAFTVLLDEFVRVRGSEEADEVRQHLLELFTLVGAGDPEVKAARAKLSTLVF
ncbi:MAG: tetratricopeptide repeat protein [Actinomycetaceae bacterium]|nr:tetratricopeptide repeat protein [Actinomycetaceae bacterium]